MIWNRLKRLFGAGNHPSPRQSPEIHWVEAAENPWGVRVLDVRPVTLTYISTTTDPKLAANAVSYSGDDGSSFIGKRPSANRSVDCKMHFQTDRVFAEGVLFVPQEMEHKWAIFYRRGSIIFVRSWLREVAVVAQIECRSEELLITKLEGAFIDKDESPEFTIRCADYLLRSHALGQIYPAPLPIGMEAAPRAAAIWCMSTFGNRAHFASAENLPWHDPKAVLRTYSLLHIAASRNDQSAVEASIAAGIPVDQLDGDGLGPLHWAAFGEGIEMLSLLIERGAPVDMRGNEGTTPLMLAADECDPKKIALLIDRGADVNLRDNRGFTALHRVAERGNLECVEVLLKAGASIDPQANGKTAKSLAASKKHTKVIELLDQHSRSS